MCSSDLVRHFIYDSTNLRQLDEFSQNSGIDVMIINMQAFNASMNEDKNSPGRSGNAAARIIYTKRDEFGSRRPIDSMCRSLSSGRSAQTMVSRVKNSPPGIRPSSICSAAW